MNTDRATIIANYRQRIAEGKRIKLNASETQALIDGFISDIKALNSTEAIQQRCQQEIALLEEGYPQLTLSSRMFAAYRTPISQAIQAGEIALTDQNSYPHGDTREHAALAHLKYDQATNERLRAPSIATNTARQDQLQPIVVDAYLSAIAEMLNETNPYVLTAAIAAATGRRHTEIVSRGQFSATSHPYLLHFEGQQKTDDPLPFDILSLLPAESILSALEHLRQHQAVKALAQITSVNDSSMRSFNTQVNRIVKARFEDRGLVPRIAEAQTVSIHRLRGVYAAVAIYLWCPSQQHESRFAQIYLGHAPASGSTAHYQHYRIVDSEGHELRQKGVLRAQFPLPERESAPAQASPAVSAPGQIGQAQPIATAQADQSRPAPLAPASKAREAPAPAAPTAKAAPTPAPAATDALPALTDQARTLAWMAGEIEALRRQLATREQAEEQAHQLRAELSILQAKIDSLESENKTLRRRLERFEGIRAFFTEDQAAPSHPQSAQIAPATLQAPQSAPAAPGATPAAPAHSQPAATPQPDPNAPPPARRSRAIERATRIWLAIQEWNDAPGRELAQKILISPTLLEREFGIFRPAIKQFMEQHATEIAAHNQRHSLHDRVAHNRGLPPTIWDAIKQMVAAE